jgi:hypothetical protein
VYHNGCKLLASRGHGVEIEYAVPEETIVEHSDEESRALRDALPSWPSGEMDETNVSGVVENRLEDLGYK